MTRVFRLTLLAPDILAAILGGTQGPGVTLRRVLQQLPAVWPYQLDHFGHVG